MEPRRKPGTSARFLERLARDGLNSGKNRPAWPAAAYAEALQAGATLEEAAAAVHASQPPGLVLFAPGGEYFDLGRQINFYMNCAANRSKNCNAQWQELGQRAQAASGEERRQLSEEAYEVFTTNLLHIPLSH